MAFTPGTRIGPYEIISTLGQGGMGEVYRARDTRLGRDVALKVLPERLAADLDRIARFEREAQVLATLNHPHIAQIYGVEHGPAGSGRALIMELVEGETLDEHLKRGPMPLDEALPIARQIAEALEAAHEQGIVHRDLKPANIKITPNHVVKVLDFGLAKLVEQGDAAKGIVEGGGTFASAAGLAPHIGVHNVEAAAAKTADTQSPTALHPAVTSSAGMLLGTAAYMSPEQARGRPADRRSDVWAFGCVLFEMLTGVRAFQGDDVADTLAAILRGEPAWDLLPAATPPSVRRLLRRALVKDRRHRLGDMATVRLEIEDAATERPGIAAPNVAPRTRWLPWVIATVSLVLLAALAAVMLLRQPAVPAAVYRAQIMPPAELASAVALRFALSPDGSRIAFVAPEAEGRVMLWVRRLDGLTAQALAGTEGASAPFWAPDSSRVAFFAANKLKTIDLADGSIQTLADAAGVPPGAWTRDNTILFANGTMSPLFRIPATGGAAEAVTALDEKTGETAHVFPSMLPDGRHFIFNATSGQSSRGTWIGSLDSKDRTRLLEEGTNATYAGGYLFYVRDTTLLAQPFDASRLTLSGDPVPVAEDLQINTIGGRLGAFSLSTTGVLAYQSGGTQAHSRLTWFTRRGERTEAITEEGEYADVALSPDRQYVATSVLAAPGTNPDIWLFDTRRGMRARITFGASSMRPVWSADGRRIAYSARTGNSWDIHWKPIDGSGPEEALLATPADEHPLSFSPDGRYLLYAVQGSPTRNSLWILPLSGDRKPFAFVPDIVNNASAEFSPDGRRIAYVSNETGRNEVFVSAFPPPGGKWQVSTAGGNWPRWRRDGRELFFLSPERGLMAVPISTSATGLETGAPERLFEAPRTGARSPYDVAADGQRLLLNVPEAQQTITPITLLVNWPGVVSK